MSTSGLNQPTYLVRQTYCSPYACPEGDLREGARIPRSMHLDLEAAEVAADAIADDWDNKYRWIIGAVVEEWRHGQRVEDPHLGRV
jgi:hypothetical protein